MLLEEINRRQGSEVVDPSRAPEPDPYLEDLKRFRRDPENIPEWLQEELRKAEAEQD